MTDTHQIFQNGTFGQQSVDQMHVTSIPYTSSKMVIFSGTPLKKKFYRANSGKYYVTIKVEPDTLPAQPTIGQHWLVKGSRKHGHRRLRYVAAYLPS